MIHDEPLIPLSREELAAAKELARTCLGIVYLLCEAGGEEIADEPDMAKLVEKFNREAAAP